MYQQRIEELRSKHRRLTNACQEIIEKKNKTAVERARFDDMLKETKEISAEVARLVDLQGVLAASVSEERQDAARIQKLQSLSDELNMPRVKVPSSESRSIEARQDKAFRSYLRNGERAELRSELSTDPSSAGYFIPDQWAGEYQARLVSYSGLRDAGAKVVKTASAGPYQSSFSDDSGNVGVRISEGTQLTSTSPVAALNLPNAWPYSSQGILLSNSLADDIGFDLDAFVQDTAAKRIGRITNTEFTLGAAGGPSGVIPGLSVAVTTASPTAVVIGELTSLIASIDPAYKRPEAKPCFMFAPSVEAVLKSTLTSTGGAKLYPEMDEGKLLGYPYVLNVDMASLSASSKAIAFGSFLKAVLIRETAPILVASKERFAELSQSFYSVFHRQDCLVSDSSAAKLLQVHA